VGGQWNQIKISLFYHKIVIYFSKYKVFRLVPKSQDELAILRSLYKVAQDFEVNALTAMDFTN